MRRTIAAVGLVGLGLLGTTLPAIATPGNGQVEVCHQTGSEKNPVIEIDVNEEGHENGNGGDGGNGNGNSGGNGGGNGNGVGYECPDNEEPPYEEPPAEEPPAEEPPAEEQPPVVAPPVVAPPVVAPPAVVVPEAPVVKPVVKPAAKPVAKPAAAAPAAAAPVAAVPVAAPATNAGYNVQTAAGGGTESGIPAWLAALTALFTGLSAVVLARGGARARKLGS